MAGFEIRVKSEQDVQDVQDKVKGFSLDITCPGLSGWTAWLG